LQLSRGSPRRDLVWSATNEPALLQFSLQSMHAFRHTFGTLAAAEDVPVDVIQRMLGHRSLQTTTIYVQAEKRRMMCEVERVRKKNRVQRMVIKIRQLPQPHRRGDSAVLRDHWEGKPMKPLEKLFAQIRTHKKNAAWYGVGLLLAALHLYCWKRWGSAEIVDRIFRLITPGTGAIVLALAAMFWRCG
jgi:hypothetical protein